MRIAIVHDFLKEYGGAERVLEVMHEMFPDAPIYTAFVDEEGLGPHWEKMKNWKIVTSFAQKIPFITKIYSPLRFLAPLFFESFDFSEFDLVISSTNAYYAKGIVTKPRTFHLCYCHTPPRSLYGYQTRMNWQKNVFTRIYGTIINHFLRKYDFLAAKRVDQFIANSVVVSERIQKFYRRESVVIYPPVELMSKVKSQSFGKTQDDPERSRTDQKSKIQVNSQQLNANSYYLYVGKLAVAKNINLIIEVALKEGFKVKIVGKGGEEANCKLQIINSKSQNIDKIELLGEVSDEQLIDLYANCTAVIFPAVDEDFGIVPVEAMGFGKPVIAYRSGGVVETVIDGKTGVFFDEPTVSSLVTAIKKLEKLKIKAENCINQAQKFSKEEFKKKLLLIIEKSQVKSD